MKKRSLACLATLFGFVSVACSATAPEDAAETSEEAYSLPRYCNWSRKYWDEIAHAWRRDCRCQNAANALPEISCYQKGGTYQDVEDYAFVSCRLRAQKECAARPEPTPLPRKCHWSKTAWPVEDNCWCGVYGHKGKCRVPSDYVTESEYAACKAAVEEVCVGGND